MNKNELLVSFILTLILTPFMGVLGLVALIVCPLLYAYSGMEGHDKIWRRLGVPIIWASAIFAHYHHLEIFLAIPMSFGALSIGYGIPDNTDEGSWLGRFYMTICNQNVVWSNILTRGTIYLLALLPMIWLR